MATVVKCPKCGANYSFNGDAKLFLACVPCLDSKSQKLRLDLAKFNELAPKNLFHVDGIRILRIFTQNDINRLNCHNKHVWGGIGIDCNGKKVKFNKCFGQLRPYWDDLKSQAGIN